MLFTQLVIGIYFVQLHNYSKCKKYIDKNSNQIYNKFASRCEENACLLINDELYPFLPSTEEVSTSAGNEDGGLERKEELGIFQVL